jgi:hypothetical protein
LDLFIVGIAQITGVSFEMNIRTDKDLIIYQNSYYLVQEGTLDKATHITMTDTLHRVKNQPGFQLYWKQRRGIFFKDFMNITGNAMIVRANLLK